MNERILQLMDSQHMNQQLFAELLGISSATISSIKKGRTQPTLGIVEAIKKKFPTINTDWLIFGKGPMFIDDKSGTSSQSVANQTQAPASTSAQIPSSTPSGQAHEAVLDFNDDSDRVYDDGNSGSYNRTVRTAPNSNVVSTPKIINTQPKRISQILVFYDDKTWETFVPKK